MTTNDVFAVSGISEGQKVQLARITRGWRQVDLACFAGVNVSDVCTLEHNRYLLPTRKTKILKCLGLVDAENESSNRGGPLNG
jgi:DNA-binding XRE family transcriptional regulator